MTLQLGSSIIRGYLTNEIPGLITGELQVAGLREPMALQLSGNFLRDVAGCRLDFTNPIPQSNPYFISLLAQRQVGEAGEITASRRILRAVSSARPPKSFVAQAPATSLKNLMFIEWFNAEGHRVVIQSWHWQIRASAPLWMLSKEEELQLVKQNRARRKAFLLDDRRSPQAPPASAPSDDPFMAAYPSEPSLHVSDQPSSEPDFTLFEAATPSPETQEKVQAHAARLAADLEKLESHLSRPVGVLTRPTLASLLQSIADLSSQLAQTMRHFATLPREGWSYLMTDVEQSLLLLTAAVNVCEETLNDQALNIDRAWLDRAQTKLKRVEQHTSELLDMMRR
jgi:hypothetical protein